MPCCAASASWGCPTARCTRSGSASRDRTNLGCMRILVTGATDGLGRYVTTELTKAGHRVLAHGRNPEKLRALHDELGVDTVQADLGELRQVDQLADEVLQRLDHLDVLVNNAGIRAGARPRKRAGKAAPGSAPPAPEYP